MPRIVRRPEAETDLLEIWWYIAQDSPHNADKFLDRLQESFFALAGFPQMGNSRDELITGLRSHSVGNYLVFYFPLEDGIDIVRILHGARDIERLF